MEERVNNHVLDADATERRGSETPAGIRNCPLKGVGADPGRQIRLESRNPRVRRAFGRSDRGGKQAAEKIF